MKNRILLLIFITGLSFNLSAQDTIRHLIFTVWNGAQMQQAFAQITNVGDSTIDLSKFTFGNINSATAAIDIVNGVPVYVQVVRFSKRLSGHLAPGESFLIMNVWDALQPDGRPYQLEQMVPLADLKVHCTDLNTVSDTINPAMELWGKDSIDTYDFILRNWSGAHANVLFYHLPNGDSVMIDQVNLAFNSTTMKLIDLPSSVAGVADASFYNLLVRKANIKVGNPIWDNSRGVTPETSEWEVLPKWQTRDIYSVIKNFGDYHISLQSSTVGINTNDKILQVPWGIRKDSLIHEFTLGKGMAWHYVEDTIQAADSAHIIVQDGDIFNVYACGNTLEEIDFKVNVSPPANNMALVFPTRYLVHPSSEQAATGALPFWYSPLYYVTENNPVIDTIGNVPFATRIDTLYKYLEWASNASAEMIWVDGNKREDLKNGDILKITAGDGSTTKEYFIDVHDYLPSSNNLLAAITWPDKSDYLDGWKEDTIPFFDPAKTSYSVTLPYGTSSIPSLMASPQNLRAKISTERAVSLKGSISERTTVFTVTAEDDSTIIQYSVTFNVDIPDNLIQKYYADPFVSEIVTNVSSWNSFLEIVNPGNTPLDLSQYMIVSSRSSLNPAQAVINAVTAVPTAANFQQRYLSYIPGYKYSDDTTQWIMNPGKLEFDPNIDPVIEPGNTFVIATSNVGREQYLSDVVRLKLNKWFNTGPATHITPDGTNVLFTPGCLKRATEALFIYKINNDSIFEGTKAVGDPKDFTLIDVVADAVIDAKWIIAGKTILASTTCRMTSKPHIYKGVTTIGEGLGTNADDSDWKVEMYPADFPNVFDMYNNIGSHNLDPVTIYLSTISSLTFIVSDGFSGLQTVQGDLSGKTVSDFYSNIAKADIGQSLTLKSGANGSVKALTDPATDGDTLIVLSADKLNTTKYKLINQPLDSDVLLVAKGGSGYVINVSGNVGTISGMPFGTTLEEVFGNVIKPELAMMSIIDQDGNLVPFKRHNYDSAYVKTTVGDFIFLEVVAQDGNTKVTYKLAPTALSSEAYVISSIFIVDIPGHTVSGLPGGTSVISFLANIEPVIGATVKLVDKTGKAREMGLLYYDDKLIVTSQDQSNTVTYLLNFIDEPVNLAPVVNAYYDGSVIRMGTAVQIKAHVEDDGRPNPATYIWEVIEGNSADVTISDPNDTLTNVTFAVAGTYKLKITATDGELVTSSTISLDVTFPDNVIQNDTPGVNIYPNPATSNINIELQNLKDSRKKLKIYDIIGKVVYNNEFTGNKIVIDVSNFRKGLYVITLESGNYHTIHQVSIIK